MKCVWTVKTVDKQLIWDMFSKTCNDCEKCRQAFQDRIWLMKHVIDYVNIFI